MQSPDQETEAFSGLHNVWKVHWVNLSFPMHLLQSHTPNFGGAIFCDTPPEWWLGSCLNSYGSWWWMCRLCIADYCFASGATEPTKHLQGAQRWLWIHACETWQFAKGKGSILFTRKFVLSVLLPCHQRPSWMPLYTLWCERLDAFGLQDCWVDLREKHTQRPVVLTWKVINIWILCLHAETPQCMSSFLQASHTIFHT